MKDVYISKRRIIILLFFYALTLTCLVQKTFGQVNPTLNTYGVPGLIDMPIARTDEKLLALVLGAESCGFYKLACSIEADDLNGVFRTGNIGPEEDIKRHPKNPMSSVSVGDVIVDTSTDKRFVVAPQGFKEVPALESSLAKLLADKYLEGRIPAPSSYLEIAYQNNLEMR